MGKKSEPADTPRKGVNTRITDELRRRLDAAAEASGRSVGAEIEHRLEASFDADAFFSRGGFSYVRSNKAPAALFGALAEAFQEISAVARERGFSEIETREALATAMDVVKHYHLWTGDPDLPELDGPEPARGLKKRELPPKPLGHEVAHDVILWNLSWNEEPVPEDTQDGRIANHWSSDGSLIEAGPTKDEVSAESAAAMKEAQRALDAGEIEFETPENLSKYTPVRTFRMKRRQQDVKPLKEVFKGR